MKSILNKIVSTVLAIGMIISIMNVSVLANDTELVTYYTVVSDTKMSSDLAEFTAVSILTTGAQGYQGSKTFTDHGEDIGNALKLAWRNTSTQVTSMANYIYTTFNSGKKLPIANIWEDGYLKFDIYIPSSTEKPSPTIPSIRLHINNANTTKPMLINTQVTSYNAWHTVQIKLSDFETTGAIAGQNVGELRFQWGNGNGDTNFTDVYVKNMEFMVPETFLDIATPAVTSEGVVLTWDGKAAKYNVYRNNVMLAQDVTATTYTDATATAGLYNYKVESLKADGTVITNASADAYVPNTNAVEYAMVIKNGEIQAPFNYVGYNGSETYNSTGSSVLGTVTSPSITGSSSYKMEIGTNGNNGNYVRFGPEQRFPKIDKDDAGNMCSEPYMLDVSSIKDTGYFQFLVYADTKTAADLPTSIVVNANRTVKASDGTGSWVAGSSTTLKFNGTQLPELVPNQWNLIKIPIYANDWNFKSIFNPGSLNDSGVDLTKRIVNIQINFPSVRTAKYNLYIEEMGFYTDGNKETTMTAVESEDGSVNITIDNVPTGENVKFIVAQYGAGENLVYAELKELTDSTVVTPVEGATRVKAFLWDDMVPITGAADVVLTPAEPTV